MAYVEIGVLECNILKHRQSTNTEVVNKTPNQVQKAEEEIEVTVLKTVFMRKQKEWAAHSPYPWQCQVSELAEDSWEYLESLLLSIDR